MVERKRKRTKMAPETEAAMASVCARGPAESRAYFSEARIILAYPSRLSQSIRFELPNGEARTQNYFS